jgi:hypothetical protein
MLKTRNFKNAAYRTVDPVVAGSSPVTIASRKSRILKGLWILAFLAPERVPRIWGQFGEKTQVILRWHSEFIPDGVTLLVGAAERLRQTQGSLQPI